LKQPVASRTQYWIFSDLNEGEVAWITRSSTSVV
jgi:hypothetical protein